MGKTRAKQPRHRPPARADGPTPVSLVTSAARLNDALSALPTGPTQHPLHNALTELIRHPTPAAQLDIARHLPFLLHHPTDPTLRLRIAHLVEALSHWHRTSPSDALTVFLTLLNLTLSSSHTRDSAALAATLRAVSATLSTAPSDEPTRLAGTRHAHSLIPCIHVALFQPRQAYLPAHDSSATSDAAVAPATRVAPIRPHAIHALHAVASAAPTAVLPFWPQLLPTAPGVARSAPPPMQNLAHIILYDADVNLRSTAVSVVTTLIASAKPFIRRVAPAPQSTAPSFVPASARVINACTALHDVVAAALRTDTSRVVVPKLARLAAELVAAATPPAVSVPSFEALVRALRDTLVDRRAFDFTARAATGSALSSAIAAGGHALSDDVLLDVCAQIVRSFNATSPSQGKLPFEEMLGVLRSAISIQPNLFRSMWDHLRRICVSAVTGGDAHHALHVVRLIESYALALLQKWREDGYYSDEDVELACVTYRLLIRDAVWHEFHSVQTTAVVAIDSLMQLLDARRDAPSSDSCAVIGTADGDAQTPRDTMLEVLHTLLQVGQPTSPVTVQSVVMKALSNTPVGWLGDEELLAIERFLHDAVLEPQSDMIVRGRAMGSSAAILERGRRLGRQLTMTEWKMCCQLVDFAHDYLLSHTVESTGTRTSSGRTHLEASRVAAIHLVAAFLCMPWGELDCKGWVDCDVVSRENLTELLCGLVCEAEAAVNTRCASCKAIGHVLATTVEDREVGCEETEMMLKTLHRCLSIEEPARVQGTAAMMLTKMVRVEFGPLNRSDVVQVCAVGLQEAGRKLRDVDGGSKERTQLQYLQNALSELICEIFSDVQYTTTDFAEHVRDATMDGEGRVALTETLLRAVCLHFEVPRHQGHKVLACARDGLAPIVNEDDASISTLSKAVRDIVKKVLSAIGADLNA